MLKRARTLGGSTASIGMPPLPSICVRRACQARRASGSKVRALVNVLCRAKMMLD
jgi:hypothetical protein